MEYVKRNKIVSSKPKFSNTLPEEKSSKTGVF